LQIPASTQTADSRPSLSTDEVARQWLVKFVAVTGQKAEPVLFEIWSEQLRDIPPERLDAACDRLMKSWRFPKLPLPGDVRAQLDGADTKGFELEAQTEWQKLLAWIRENVFPDTGIRRGAPRLAPAVEHAAKAAGGVYYIERCSEDQLGWCRKTFLAAYKNVHETAQAEHLLGEGEAKRILARLAAGPERKQLAAVLPSVPQSDSGGIPREEIRATLQQITKSPEPELPSEEEWQARKDRLKQSALEWAASHGLASPAPEQPVEVSQ
jgi:hypothetical protein